MRKSIFFIILIFFTSTIVSTTLPASQRGIRVTARTQAGSTKEIKLYSGYHALVVGCSEYTQGWPRLPNPVKDAREVSDALKKLGFTINMVENPDSHQLRNALNELVSGAGRDPKKAIFVFFAGHGHTLKRADGTKLGYIVPVDTPNPEDTLSGFMNCAVSMREVEEISTLIKSKHVLMAFDSCFSGSIFRAASGAPSRYIREQAAKPVRAFIAAGDENERVADDSVFKTCLIQGLLDRYADLNDDGYVTGDELGLYLKKEVIDYTEGTQHPHFGKIKNPALDKGDFVFIASGKAIVEKPQTPVTSQCTLRIETNPSGATVWIDSKKKGDAPLMIRDLAPGRMKVRASLEGYTSKEEDVYIRSGRETRLTLILDPLITKGSMSVTSDPPGATWYLDGAYVGTTPDEMKRLDEGRYTVEIKKDGYKDYSDTVTLRAGETNRIYVKLAAVDTADILGMEFVYIPPGTFMMGSPSGEAGRNDDEGQHRVTLTKGFYMQTTEVTVGQWRAFVRETGYRSEAEKGDGAWIWLDKKWEKKAGYYWDNPGFEQTDKHPVTCVSWNDTHAFIKWLNEKGDKTYRLPTEAEWEYACRAGTKTARFWGDDPDEACKYANVADLTEWNGKHWITKHNCNDRHWFPSPAGSFRSNSWGLYDMLGNVWEWCEDWHDTDYYKKSPKQNPKGPTHGTYRVLRGGSWDYYPRGVRCAYRGRADPDYRSNYIGFRVLLVFPQ